MTRFRDAKVCNNLVTDEIDDHKIRSDYKCTIGLQYPEEKKLHTWSLSTFHTAHMNINTWIDAHSPVVRFRSS